MSGEVARRQWRDAIKHSTLKSSPRLVALLMADWWRHDSDLLWVETDILAEESGLSRRAVQTALDVLEAHGWLVMVEAARQHRCPRFAPTIPEPVDNPSRGADSASLPDSRGADIAPLGRLRGADFASRGADSAPDTKETLKTTTTKARTSPVDGLALVVVEALPGNLGQSITRSVLDKACARLAAAGWNPETLAQTARERPWGDVRAGGVIQWLRGLPAPPQPHTAPPRCPECIDGWLRDERGERSATRCPSCRPRAVAS